MDMLKIQEVCKERGFTMQALAKSMGVTYQALHATVTGNPTIGMLQKIATALGVPVTDLFEKTEGDFKCPNCGASLNVYVEMSTKK